MGCDYVACRVWSQSPRPSETSGALIRPLALGFRPQCAPWTMGFRPESAPWSTGCRPQCTPAFRAQASVRHLDYRVWTSVHPVPGHGAHEAGVVLPGALVHGARPHHRLREQSRPQPRRLGSQVLRNRVGGGVRRGGAGWGVSVGGYGFGCHVWVWGGVTRGVLLKDTQVK